MTKLSLPWPEAWEAFKAGTPEAQRSFARQLDQVNGGFVHWIKTRPQKVQEEIVLNAPEGIVRGLYESGALTPRTIMEMNLQPSGVKVIDHRSRR